MMTPLPSRRGKAASHARSRAASAGGTRPRKHLSSSLLPCSHVADTRQRAQDVDLGTSGSRCAARGDRLAAMDYYHRISGSVLQAYLDMDWTAGLSPPGAVPPHPGKPGGVDVVAAELFGYMGVSSSVGGSGTWTSTQVINGGLSDPGKTASNPSITVNNGSVNIAVEGESGDLWFFWEDSSGAFHQETVDTAANLS